MVSSLNLFLIVFLGLSNTETALILLCCFFVLVTETLNTCVEKICDYIQPEFDSRIGIIKDLAGGAVMLATISAISVGALVYWPYLILLFYWYNLNAKSAKIFLSLLKFVGVKII